MNHLDKLKSELNLSIETRISDEGLTVLRILSKNPEEIVDDVIKLLTRIGYEVRKLRMEEPTLEDVFMYFASE